MKTYLIRTTILPFLLCFCLVITSQLLSAQTFNNVQVTSFTADSRNGNVGLSWKTSGEKDLQQFDVEFSRDGKYFRDLGFIPARNALNGDIYEFEQPVMYTDSAFYRIRITDKYGRSELTDPVLYRINKISAFFVYPSVIDNSVINVYVEDPFSSLQIVNMAGEVMLKQNLSGKTGNISIPISPAIQGGIYIVQLKGQTRTITQKVVING